MNKEVIVYCRRSTKRKQEHSLENQRIEIERFCKEHGLKITKRFLETMSGKSIDRPILQKAIQMSNKLKIPIIITDLDRLGRTASEVIDLALTQNIIIVEHGIHQYDRFTINLMATFAEKERELISKRTKQGLRAAKSRGVKLGNPRLKQAQQTSARKRQAEANEFAMKMQRLFNNFNHLNNTELSKSLNDWSIPTRNGNTWYPETVRRIRNRLTKHKR